MRKLIRWIISKIALKNYIVLESKSDFCDSTKTFFDYLIANNFNKKYKITWIVENPEEFKDKKIKNVKFINNKRKLSNYFRLRCSKYYIYTHTFIGNVNNKKQIKVFVTHAAMPFKNSTGLFWDASINTYILGTSEHCIFYRNKCLSGDLGQYKITGLPRNDDLFVRDYSLKEKLGINEEKFILWMPTFKHHRNGDNHFNFEETEDISILSPDNLKKINDQLKKLNMKMIIKPHPSQDLKFFSVEQHSNILFVTNNDLLKNSISLYQLLAISDALITDFSSVFLDYLLVDKPIAFDLCDQKVYTQKVGYIMDNPEDYMVGDKIYFLKDLLVFIKKVKNNDDSYSKARQELCDKIHCYKDNKSSERLAKLLNLKVD